MAEDDETDLFRLWLERQGRLAQSGEGWEAAEALFGAWSRFVSAFAEEDARARAEGRAKAFDPAGWLRPEGEGGMADLWRWLEGPAFADLFAAEREAMRATGEFAAYAAALERFRAVAGTAWTAAFKEFAAETAKLFADAKRRGEPEPAWSAIRDRWVETADAEFARMQQADEFVSAERDLLETGLALKARLRERVERAAAFLGLPTRAELDDLHATVTDLRRRLANGGQP